MQWVKSSFMQSGVFVECGHVTDFTIVFSDSAIFFCGRYGASILNIEIHPGLLKVFADRHQGLQSVECSSGVDGNGSQR